MGFWRKLFGIEERSAGSNDNGVLDGGAELLRALIGGDEFTAEQALEIPAFSAAVDFISGTVSMLPVKLYRENTADSSTEEITDDPRLFLLNDEANPVMGADNAKRAAIRDMLLFGSGFLYVEQSNFGDVKSLRYVKRSDVSVMSNADPIFKDFNLFVGSRGYLPWNFVILTRNSTDGVTGTGTVDEHKTLLSAMYFMMKFERVLSKTGGNKKGFLESEHKLSKEALAKIQQTWNELYANNERNMMILNDGLKYVPSASSSVEMQLNENKLTNSDLTTLIFGLSTAALSGKCTTQEYMSAIRTAVLPIVAQFQSALNRALLREDEKGEKYFALDTTELLKGDTLSRYQAYEIALRNNFLQLDEVRYLEDKKPIGFDFLKLGLNDVLYDAKTNTIYTPNMNALQKLGDQSLTQEEMRAIMEYRKKTNWINGAHGYFAGSYPEGGGGGIGGNSGLTNGANGGIINTGSIKAQGRNDNMTAENDAVSAQSILNKQKTENIIKRGISEEKAIFDDGILGERAKHFKPESGFYDVTMHGTPETALFFGEKIDSHTLAQIIKQRSDYNGEPVRLLSCNTGKQTNTISDCFAQRLANELKVDVKAPNNTLWAHPVINGVSEITVGSTKNDVSGKLVTFNPRYK